MSLFLSIIVFIGLCGVMLSLHMLITDARDAKKQKKLRELSAQLTGTEKFEPSIRSAPKIHCNRFGPAAAAMERLERLLRASDTPVSAGLFGLGCLIAGGLCFFVSLGVLKNIFPAVLMFITGGSAPLYYLVVRGKKREEDLVRQLPEALEMITRSLRIGQSMDNSLRELGRSFPRPLGGEIKTVYEEIAMGLPFAAAMQHFESRYPRVAEIKMFSAAMVIQRESGGNLTRILENLSKLIRERFKFHRQVRALTSEGRASAIIVGSLPLVFAAIVWFSNPGYLDPLFFSSFGRKLLLVAALLETSGFIIMRRLTKIDV